MNICYCQCCLRYAWLRMASSEMEYEPNLLTPYTILLKLIGPKIHRINMRNSHTTQQYIFSFMSLNNSEYQFSSNTEQMYTMYHFRNRYDILILMYKQWLCLMKHYDPFLFRWNPVPVHIVIFLQL